MADVFRHVGRFYKVLSLLSFKILTLERRGPDTSSDVQPSTEVCRSSSIRAPYEAEIHD